MDEYAHQRIVVIGAGASGTLAANRIRSNCPDGAFRIVVIDRIDVRDPEVELLVALGRYGPRTLQPPEHLRLRDGIDLRHIEVTSVVADRAEVCLADGTTLAYDALVIATGHHQLSPGLDAHGYVPVDPRTLRSATMPEVFALGAAAGSRPSAGMTLHVQAETLARSVSRLLTENRATRREASAAAGAVAPTA